MEEVVKMLKDLKFKKSDKIKEADVYGVVIKTKKTDMAYVLCCCIFKDRYVFTIQDSHGIVQLCNFKKNTPVLLLKSYIAKAVDFFIL